MARKGNNTVYLIDFEDGSIYIGSTKYYKNRIRRHMYALEVEGDKRPLYEKMRGGVNYSFHIHRQNIKTEEEMRVLEKKLTKIYVRMGYEVLNIANTELDKNATPKELIHETKEITKSSFKRFCNTWGLNFDDFITVWKGYRDEFLNKKYIFVHKDRVAFVDMNEVEFVDTRHYNEGRPLQPIEVLLDKAYTMSRFKKMVSDRGLDMKDFTWENTDIRTKKGEIKKIFKKI